MAEKLYFMPVLMEISESDCVQYAVNLSLNHNTLVMSKFTADECTSHDLDAKC